MSLRVPDEHDPWPGRIRIPAADVRVSVEIVDAAVARHDDRRSATPPHLAVSEARLLVPDPPARLLSALACGNVLLIVRPNPLPPLSSDESPPALLRDLVDDAPLLSDGSPADADEEAADAEPLHTIEVLVVDARGEPQTGILYELTLPDGSVRTGRTGTDGHLRLGGLAQTGACRITFPEVTAVEAPA